MATRTKEPADGTTGWKLRQLRYAVGKPSREKVSETSGLRRDGQGPLLQPTDVSKAELNDNEAKTDKWRRGFANAYGVSQEDLGAYLDGEIDLPELLRRRAAPRHAPTQTNVALDPRNEAIAAVRAMARASKYDAEFAETWMPRGHHNETPDAPAMWLEMQVDYRRWVNEQKGKISPEKPREVF